MPPYFLSPLLPRMHNLKGNVFLYISFFIQPSPTSMVFLIFWKLQRNDVWSLIEVLKLNFCQDFEAAVYQDIEAEVSSRFLGFSLVDILKAEVWSRFWSWILTDLWNDLKAVILAWILGRNPLGPFHICKIQLQKKQNLVKKIKKSH